MITLNITGQAISYHANEADNVEPKYIANDAITLGFGYDSITGQVVTFTVNKVIIPTAQIIGHSTNFCRTNPLF